jgi:Holliday junction DNA helicase RuvA
MQLYGFAERAERELFMQLLSVAGIGPKVALAIVSGSPAEELRRAIVREDAVRFQAIPGVGKKTAERIVLELKEKLAVTAIAPVAGGDVDDHVVARNALVELGYSIADAERVLAETDAAASPEERVRQALRRAA